MPEDYTHDRLHNSVLLAALLHDIGKLIHRRSKSNYRARGGHVAASSDFIETHKEKLKNDRLYDIDLVHFFVHTHHSPRNAINKAPYLKNKTEEEKSRIYDLVRVVKDADSYSSTERDIKDQNLREGKRRLTPIDSIFSCLSIEPEKRNKWGMERYKLNELDPLQSFPESFSELSDREIDSHIRKLEEALPDFGKFNSLDAVLAAWLDLLERYTWCVPSDTRYEFADLSLFDHLRSTAAIAACLYRTHKNEIGTGRFSRKDEIILVAGDFSGIQDYIFHITNIGTGGAAKRLRARSFYVTLFTEAAVHRVLHALELPFLCNVFSAGGKFMLLVPNADGTEDKLKGVKEEIVQEIHRRHFSVFSFLMSWKKVGSFKKDMKVLNFVELADDMFYRLEREKVRKAHGALTAAGGRWDPEAFKASELYESYDIYGDCKVCGRGPAERKDNDEGEVDSCHLCYTDKFLIGQNLPKAEFVAFGRGRPTEDDERIWLFDPGEDGSDGYYAEILEKQPEEEEDGGYYLLYALGDVTAKGPPPGPPVIKRFIANYVPTAEEGGKRQILPFDKIGRLSRWKNSKGMECGSDLLGVLKVDIDNLGLLFSKGFEYKKDGGEGEDCDRKTPSRFLTLSRMIDLFFSGWMKKSPACFDRDDVKEMLSGLEGCDVSLLGPYLDQVYLDFRNIYTVYSAGDDMLLVGPWETMIIFAMYLQQSFTRHTGRNPAFTISAGLAFVKPKYPAAYAIRLAEELLEKSKEAGKDRITFFGTTIEWKALGRLVDFFLRLDGFLNDEDSSVNTSFLFRLLSYHEMALGFLEEKRVEGLKYLSTLSYDIGRNIIKWDKDGRLVKGAAELKLFELLKQKPPEKGSLVSNLKIPLFWTLYRNRRADSDERI